MVLKSTLCTEHTIIVPPKEEFISKSSLLNSVTVSMSTGVFLISPGGESYVVIVDCCNHAQNTVVTTLTAMLTASGYLSTLAIFTLRHTAVLTARINWRKVVYSTLKDSSWGKIYKAPEIGRFSIKLWRWWFFTAKFGNWSETILESKCSWGFDFILLPFFTKEARSRQEPRWI